MIAVAVVLASCGGGRAKQKPTTTSTAIPRPATAGDRMLALLPDGAQLVIEVDLARLRTNPVVGALITKVIGGDTFPQLAGFADADGVVFAAYGLGTAQAATITLFTAKQQLANTTKISGDIYAVGPTEWVAQVEARAAIDAKTGVVAAKDLIDLRDRAMPESAPGASIRIAARLSFDARVALARITGIESAPGQLSVWVDVVDDLAVIVDADATDPGDKKQANAVKRMSAVLQGALSTLARDPTIVALGLPSSISGAKLATRGTWVRAIIAVGPRHLQRVVERATLFFNKAGT